MPLTCKDPTFLFRCPLIVKNVVGYSRLEELTYFDGYLNLDFLGVSSKAVQFMMVDISNKVATALELEIFTQPWK